MKSLVNKVSLVGTLGRDPEVTTFDSGKKKATISVATNETYKNDQGEKVEVTDWHRVILWGKKADFAEQYLTKGKKIILEGKLSTRSFEKNGEKQYVTEVTADDVLILSPKKDA